MSVGRTCVTLLISRCGESGSGPSSSQLRLPASRRRGCPNPGREPRPRCGAASLRPGAAPIDRAASPRPLSISAMERGGFPLTLTISRGEGDPTGSARSGTRPPPLLAGEAWGEGKSTGWRKCTFYASGRSALTLTLSTVRGGEAAPGAIARRGGKGYAPSSLRSA